MTTTASDPDDPDAWKLQAKCRGLPTSLFVPNKPGGTLEPVVAICWGRNDGIVCPVRRECEVAGEEHNELGVWGGYVRSTKVHLRATREMKVHDVIQDSRPKRMF